MTQPRLTIRAGSVAEGLEACRGPGHHPDRGTWAQAEQTSAAAPSPFGDAAQVPWLHLDKAVIRAEKASRLVRLQAGNGIALVAGATVACGGFGRVRMGIDIRTGRALAIKQTAKNSQHESAQSIFEEVCKVASLSAKIRVLGTYCRPDKRKWGYFMSAAAGSLHELLDIKFGPLPRATRIHLARHTGRQVGAELGRLHQRGWVHGDVKLSNILLENMGQMYLADYGSAMRLDAWGLGTESFLQCSVCTLCYLQTGHICAAIDIFGLGFSLWRIYVPELSLYGVGVEPYQLTTDEFCAWEAWVDDHSLACAPSPNLLKAVAAWRRLEMMDSAAARFIFSHMLSHQSVACEVDFFFSQFTDSGDIAVQTLKDCAPHLAMPTEEMRLRDSLANLRGSPLGDLHGIISLGAQNDALYAAHNAPQAHGKKSQVNRYYTMLTRPTRGSATRSVAERRSILDGLFADLAELCRNGHFAKAPQSPALLQRAAIVAGLPDTMSARAMMLSSLNRKMQSAMTPSDEADAGTDYDGTFDAWIFGLCCWRIADPHVDLTYFLRHDGGLFGSYLGLHQFFVWRVCDLQAFGSMSAAPDTPVPLSLMLSLRRVAAADAHLGRMLRDKLLRPYDP